MEHQIVFPDPKQADDEGLVAVGGELTQEYLLAAYSQGVFPWFAEGEPILWWSPNPRLVLIPDEFKISKSLGQTLRNKEFEVRIDTNFEEVIEQCAAVKRQGQQGTWITAEMKEAYIELYENGYAHSIEIYQEDKLIGGLYGVSLGKAFFGESMFHRTSDASKVALSKLVEIAQEWDFHFIDAQQSTQHLKSLGAKEVERIEFLRMLEEALQFPTLIGRWKYDH